MKISKSKLIQVIKEELTAVLAEESADEREDKNIDSLWRYARQNRRALNKLLKEAGHDELEGERPDTDEEAARLGDSTSGVNPRGYGSSGPARWSNPTSSRDSRIPGGGTAIGSKRISQQKAGDREWYARKARGQGGYGW